ncbi:uncharacterized protein J4E87_004927 [Alternaria ethzedia]|uniref:uncharacterized protein n=1 Tax=Alternaria ethzedia TaxID=181014 RepID=UPI0020C3F3C6|nr:uncharacterized protein J4E87_004927 [Alternaria ethzedia]KAI4625081.1 hypothetical protein J4E87_004927 [Alternaria ethzedia]
MGSIDTLESSVTRATMCKKCTNGNKVTIDFPDGSFTFHSQWLRDARFDNGAARNAETAMCQQPLQLAQVEKVRTSSYGLKETLDISWKDGVNNQIPLPWLRVMAPLVAAPADDLTASPAQAEVKGWTVDSLHIPEVSYSKLFAGELEPKDLEETILSIIDRILGSSAPGIVKIVDLPAPNMEEEHSHKKNINTQVLKRLFGAVFVHPIRGADQTFNVSSHSGDANRKIGLPNYDTTQILLPHTDHAFYDNPIQVQGFYGLEGTSENTWISSLQALETLRSEDPESYRHLCNAPVAFGRVSKFYGEPLYQATTDTAVTMHPGYPDRVKRVRWHPNLTGYLCSPYADYKAHRLAHQKFEEIMRRPSHQLKIVLKPGDLYVWDNFRLMHGREKVLTTPRTGVGQTVPENVVHDRYRALCVNMLKGHIDGDWLCHMPMQQLRELVKLFQGGQEDIGN